MLNNQFLFPWDYIYEIGPIFRGEWQHLEFVNNLAYEIEDIIDLGITDEI